MEQPQKRPEDMDFAEQIQHQANATTGNETWRDISRGADATSKAIAVLAIAGVGILAGGLALTRAPSTTSVTVAKQESKTASLPQQTIDHDNVHIGTAVQGFRDPKSGGHGALYSAQKAR